MAQGKPVKAFNADLKQLTDRLQIDLGTAIRKVVLDTHAKTTELAPVKTGRYRASWGVSPIDVPNDPGERPSASVPASAAASRVNTSVRDPFVVWWIYNNLPYAEALENGSSSQAPDGVIDLALATVEAEIDTAIKTLVLV